MQTIKPFLALLLVPTGLGASDRAPPLDRVRLGEIVPVFAGDWQGTWRSGTGSVEITISFEREGYTTREVLAPGNIAYGKGRGGIRARPDGTAWFDRGNACWRGIYRMEGSRVRLCFSRSGAQPTGFGLAPDTTEWLIEPISVKK